jgi:hypothetical protein
LGCFGAGAVVSVAGSVAVLSWPIVAAPVKNRRAKMERKCGKIFLIVLTILIFY